MRQLLLTSGLLLSACGQVQPTPAPDDLVPTATPELVNAPTPTATPEPTPTATPEPTPTTTPIPEPRLITSWQDVVGTWHRDLLKGDVMTHLTMSFDVPEYSQYPDSKGFFRERYSENDEAEKVSEGWYEVLAEGELSHLDVHEPGQAQSTDWVSTQCYRYEAPVRLLCAGWGQPFYQTSTSPEPR